MVSRGNHPGPEGEAHIPYGQWGGGGGGIR